MSLILITGGNGLVGSHLVRQLFNQGHQLRVLRRHSSDTTLLEEYGRRIEWVEGDILDVMSLERAFAGVTHVVHAAAVVSFLPKERDNMYAVNVTGTANVVNVALMAGVQKMLYVSSIAALGRPSPHQMSKDTVTYIDEDQKWEESPLNSHYGKSKYLAELEVWRGAAEGLPVLVVCPSMILGEGDWKRSSTQLFKYVFDEKKYYTEGLINYVDVKDVVQIIAQLLFSDLQNERFILNAGHTTYENLFEKMAKSFNKKAPYKPVTSFMAAIIWRIEALRSWLTGSRPLITRETAQTSRNQIVYKNKKIVDALNVEFTPLDQSINRICKALNAQ